MNLTFTEVVPRTVFSFNFLRMLANGPPLFGSGVLESIFSSAAVEWGGSSGCVVTDWDIIQTRPCIVHPLTPNFFYSRIVVYRGIHHFSYFSFNTKVVGTRNEYPLSMFLSKNKKKVTIFHLKITFLQP